MFGKEVLGVIGVLLGIFLRVCSVWDWGYSKEYSKVLVYRVDREEGKSVDIRRRCRRVFFEGVLV